METHPGPLLSEGRLYNKHFHIAQSDRSISVDECDGAPLTAPCVACAHYRLLDKRARSPSVRLNIRYHLVVATRDSRQRCVVGTAHGTRTTHMIRRARIDFTIVCGAWWSCACVCPVVPLEPTTWWGVWRCAASVKCRRTRRPMRARRADGYRVCLVFLSLASDQGGSPAEFKHISKRRKRN